MGTRDSEDEQGEHLHKQHLTSVTGTAALGLVVSKRLLEAGVCTVHLNSEGFVQLAGVGEVTMDALPEPMALQELTRRGYTDADLAEYLEGRDARMGRG